MNTEQYYLEQISRLEEEKRGFLAEQEARIKIFGEQNKSLREKEKEIKSLENKLNDYEQEKEEDLEKTNQLKERIKELTNRDVIGNLKKVIESQTKGIEFYIASENKRKQMLWSKDQEIMKSNNYLKQLNSLVVEKDQQIKKLEEWKEHYRLYQQKITDLENALTNLAKQKISNNQEWNNLLNHLKNEWDSEKELILDSAERGRDEQAEEIVALETENIELHNKLEEAEKELDEQDQIIFEKDETISNLQQRLNQKSIINDIERMIEIPSTYPEKRINPLPMNDRDKQIIQQAQAHLEPLVNTTTLRNRVLEAKQTEDKEAYWELHTDLQKAGKYLDKLIRFHQGDLDNVHQFTYTLGAILRGERLNEIENK